MSDPSWNEKGLVLLPDEDELEDPVPELPPWEEGFIIDSPQRLARYARTINRIDSELAHVTAMAEAMKARLRKEKADYSERYGQQALEFVMMHNANLGKKGKFLDTMFGRVQVRDTKASFKVRDGDALLDYYKQKWPELIDSRYVEFIPAENLEMVKGTRVDENGEVVPELIVPGVEFVPAGMSVNVQKVKEPGVPDYEEEV